MKIHVLQHVPYEGPGRIAPWLQERGHTLTYTRFYEDPALPASLRHVQGLVIMGGPMGVNDEETLPWLGPEKAFIKKALAADLPILGVCLGAQLMASALGAKVYPNRQKEIGWFEVEQTPEGLESGLLGSARRFEPFHWHGDTFDLPLGAIRLAKSGACSNQAFAVGGRALGLQFHVEASETDLEMMTGYGSDELKLGGSFVQSADKIMKQSKKCGNLQPILEQMLGSIFT
jgi:GMP synthase-like glutamine amidotransferase